MIKLSAYEVLVIKVEIKFYLRNIRHKILRMDYDIDEFVKNLCNRGSKIERNDDYDIDELVRNIGNTSSSVKVVNQSAQEFDIDDFVRNIKSQPPSLTRRVQQVKSWKSEIAPSLPALPPLLCSPCLPTYSISNPTW